MWSPFASSSEKRISSGTSAWSRKRRYRLPFGDAGISAKGMEPFTRAWSLFERSVDSFRKLLACLKLRALSVVGTSTDRTKVSLGFPCLWQTRKPSGVGIRHGKEVP